MKGNETQRSRQFFIETAFRPTDKVRFGPHDGVVSRLFVASNSILYEVCVWVGDEQKQFTAYEWELTLIEEGAF